MPSELDLGPWDYPEPKRLFRFFFTDGTTQDVLATGDDSNLRGWVFKRKFGKPSNRGPDRHDGGDAILGVADMTGQESDGSDGS